MHILYNAYWEAVYGSGSLVAVELPKSSVMCIFIAVMASSRIYMFSLQVGQGDAPDTACLYI